MTRCRLIFSGSGGQGIITAAKVLAEAAVIYEGLNAVQSQSYGAGARGGLSRADVIISDAEIFFPRVIQPNILVCLSQEAYITFASLIRPGGILLTDPTYVIQEKKTDARQIELDMYTNVKEKIGTSLVFNVCMLGALIGLTKIVKIKSVLKVLESVFPSNLRIQNEKVLKIGQQLAESYCKRTYFDFKFW